MNEKNIFIYAGSLGVMDDVESIIDAAILLKKNNIKDIFIYIIGDGVEKKKLEGKALGLEFVTFKGLIPKEEVAKLLQSAKATFVCFKPLEVLNTVSPNKMFDSFAAGIPIIQNTNGWIKEYVENKQCGFNVEPNNPDNMMNAIVELARNNEMFNQMSVNAREAAEKDFNREKLAFKYLNTLKSVMN